MTPTSDERRDVAQMLRIEVRDKDTSLDYPINRIINDVLGVNGAWGDKAARILADLIDPTCNFEESPDNDEFAIRVVSGYICHSCGHETIVERTAGGWAEPPHYCSNCGARLVSDDE